MEATELTNLSEFNLKALVVDDEEIIRKTLKQICEHIGLKTSTAANGVEGCEIFNSTRPNIVILDIYMPLMNGFKALQNMREVDKTVPIILITGFLRIDQIIHQAGGIQATSYLEKPFDTMKISKLIIDLLEPQIAALAEA